MFYFYKQTKHTLASPFGIWKTWIASWGLTLLLLLFAYGQARAQDYAWAKRMGGTGGDVARSVVVDASGNVYTTGAFNGTVDFDPGAGTANLTSAGVDDVFVSKLDASGNYLWAKRMGGTGSDVARSVVVDASGNVYTTGAFNGTVDFDPGAGTANLTSAGGEDIFVSKLNASGNHLWAKRMGGTTGEAGYGIAVDASGNVYTTGYFLGTADFDPGAGTANLTSAGVDDVFVSKLDASGNYLWAKGMGGTSIDIGYGIAVDASGNVYTTGSFNGTVDFDPGAGTANLTSAGGDDVFVSKLNASGNYLWAKRMGGTSIDIGYGIAVDASGNVYTTGSFIGTVDFDPGAGTANLTSAGGEDIFVSKLDASGNHLWAKRMGGTSVDIGYGIAVDAAGNVYTTGYFFFTVDFDPGASTANLISAGIGDIFVSKLSLPSVPEINLQGNSTNIADGDASPTSADHTDFGNVNVGNNLVRTYTIQNTGTATLTISGITSSNAKFVVGGAPTSIAASSSATFTVTYTPTGAGTDNATITINNNDADEAVYDFAITGVGIARNALNFDGSNDVVDCGNLASFRVSTGTIEAWIRTSNPGSSYRGIVVKENAYGIFLRGNELIAFDWTGGGEFTSGRLLNDGNWHHVAFSFQDNITNGSRLYVDGVLVGTKTYKINNQLTFLAIGNNGGNTQNINATIDEVRVWNIARTCDQIQSTMNRELVGNEAGLVAYYNFNQGTAGGTNTGLTTLNDLAGTAENGTLNNFALTTGTTSNWVDGAGNGVTGTTPQTPAEINVTVGASGSTRDVGGYTTGTPVDFTYTIQNKGNMGCNLDL